MIREDLQQAQDIIEQQLRDSGKPMKAKDLFESIGEVGIRNIDLREAVWLLIGKGKVRLDWERQLVLADEVESKAAAG